jgi:uncharacterized protein (UPF0332 family)
MNSKHLLAELARARESLQAAQLLQEKGLFADAVSRSYYAVMHAARAALLAHDTIAESHSAVRRLFGEVLVRPGRIEKEWAAVLAREQTQRIAADYDAEISWDSATSAGLTEEAKAFVLRVHAYLKSAGGVIPEEGEG